MSKRWILAAALLFAACGPNNNSAGDGGADLASGADLATGGPGSDGGNPFGGITFPWPVFDGTVPDVPPASGGGATWYADALHGDDANDGTTFAKAKKTLNAALTNPAVKAGDTILLGGGVYREYPDWYGGPTGTPSAPVVIGSYGHGTGAPILDGGSKPNAWTRYSAQGQTTVWQTSTAGLHAGSTTISSANPVLGIYVNGANGESALKEVAHGQIQQYASDPLPPNQTQNDIKDDSNDWFFDGSAQILYADFGGSLGTSDPNNADISILHKSHDLGGNTDVLVNLGGGHDYLTFMGITIRASSWSGVYSESSGITFDRCDIEFNGGTGVEFGSAGAPAQNNSLLHSQVWMNMLDNWPRFNNGWSSGGWGTGCSGADQVNALFQGNVIHGNGGEGLIIGGTDFSGMMGMNTRVIENVIYDNFSVNLYIDNAAGVTFAQNFVFQHPRDEGQTFAQLFEVSSGFREDWGRRITPVALSLGDEPGSAFDGAAHSSDNTVVNNIFAGGLFGFVDYDDGTSGVHHGLKNVTIENNTFILGDESIANIDRYGWSHLFDQDASANSFFENNLFVVALASDPFVEAAQTSGVTVDYNLYSGPGGFYDAKTLSFSAWQAATGWDAHSLNADALLDDVSEFSQSVTQRPIYDWAKAAPKPGSPAAGGGTALSIATDFTGATRAAGSHDIGALAPQ